MHVVYFHKRRDIHMIKQQIKMTFCYTIRLINTAVSQKRPTLTWYNLDVHDLIAIIFWQKCYCMRK